MVKTQEDFINKAKEIHGDKYDYSLVVYEKSLIPVKILCKEHETFLQKPAKHLQGHGCPECGNTKKGQFKKLNNEKFIEKAYKVHGNKYDYSKVEYIGSQKQVCIICPDHGEFWQESNDHLMGHGCPKCGFINTKNKIRLSLEIFIERASKVHNNKYDYSKVNYSNNHTKVCIICPDHGEFWQEPQHHLNGCGCPDCKKEKLSNLKTKSNEDFQEDSINIFGSKYNYSEVEYVNSKEKVCIICSKHGTFYQKPNDHLMGHGCPKCNQSRGERIIENWLKQHKIDFVYQKKFDECKNIFQLSFDFYLNNYNICIEYDGQHHFEPVCFGRMSYVKALLEFRKIQERDKIKNIYCFNKNINIIRIPYWEFKNVDKILSKELLGV